MKQLMYTKALYKIYIFILYVFFLYVFIEIKEEKKKVANWKRLLCKILSKLDWSFQIELLKKNYFYNKDFILCVFDAICLM